MTDEEQAPLIVDHVAESPFDEWPGRIVFPATFTGKTYRTWVSASKPQDGDTEDTFRRSEASWRALLAIADVKLDSLDSLDFDDVPYQVINWGIDVLGEYVHPFVVEKPWRSPSGNGSSK